ncbi:MAG: hypothetical protein WCR52_11210 [Bacteroidota bacterium]
MQKFLFPVALALAFSAALYNCTKTTDTLRPSGSLGDTLTIGYNQIATVAPINLQVVFKSLISDSRCPTDGICVWQGQADVEIQSKLGSATQPDSLRVGGNISPSDPDFATAFGYKIRLIDVLPYPASSNSIPVNNYSIKVVVTQ